MRALVRKLGNSSGVIIPKPILSQIGVEVGDDLDLSLDDGRIRRDERNVRRGNVREKKRRDREQPAFHASSNCSAYARVTHVLGSAPRPGTRFRGQTEPCHPIEHVDRRGEGSLLRTRPQIGPR